MREDRSKTNTTKHNFFNKNININNKDMRSNSFAKLSILIKTYMVTSHVIVRMTTKIRDSVTNIRNDSGNNGNNDDIDDKTNSKNVTSEE